MNEQTLTDDLDLARQPAETPLEPLRDAESATAEGAHGLTQKGNLLLAALFAAGIAGIYLLTFRAGPAQASADQQRIELQVDAALTQLRTAPPAPGSPGGGKDVTDVFYYEARQRQVPLGELTGNPFVFQPPKSRRSEAAAPTPQTLPTEPAESGEDSQAMEAVRKLQLQSVLTGAHGTSAMISNNVLTEGQKIAGWTVQSIQPRQVVLTWKEHSFVLRMSE